MFAGDTPLGASALLRVAGLPIRYWLAGASPALFATVEQLDRSEQGRRACAIRLAERIGEQLVPKPALSRDDRAFLLAIRRSLHRGDPIATVSRERLLRVSGLSGDDDELMRALAAMIDRDLTIAKLSTLIEADLAQEHNRLLLLPGQIYQESRVAGALLAPQGPEDPAPAELSRKSRRHRAEHEWRRIARAATGSTPRGWLSHVALLAIDTEGGLPPPSVTERFTAQWAENVRVRRLALVNPPEEWPAPESRLAVNPLRWEEDERLVCVVVDKNREHTQVSVQQTPLLDGIVAALETEAHTFGELAAAVGCANRDQWLAFRGFVRHLVTLGILQPGAPPVIRLEREATPGQSFAEVSLGTGDHGGWVDVYRYSESGLSGNLPREVQHGVSEAFRLLNVMRSDMGDPAPWPVPTSARSWSFSDILRDVLAIDRETPAPGSEDMEAAERTVPESSSSRFASLMRELVDQAGHANEVVIDSDRLDRWGAGSSALNWPVDCLVRVPTAGAGFTAVLEDSRPPGVLDARFADTLSDLHGQIPQVEAYRAFLRRVEQLTGILFVELLVPPLTDGAANAVRRPIYTSAWTGDPHADTYLRGGTAGTYIPLHEIRVQRVDGRLRAEAGGQRIWPVYHATRTFEQPWSQVARVLLATAPVNVTAQCERMSHLPSVLRMLLSEHTRLPRVLVGRGLVLSPAQWRLPCDQLWDRDSSDRNKLRALIRVRDRHTLPRWVYLLRDGHKSPVPCDLESLHAFRTIERCMTGSAPLNVIEMLPTPDQLLVVDRAHRSGDRLASQLQLRFPCDESATAMANRIAASVLTALGPQNSLPVDSMTRRRVAVRQPRTFTARAASR